MSDLIRRKKIRDYIKGEINPYGKPFEGTAYELGLKIMRYIDAMDSAYDIDKVVDMVSFTSGNADNTTEAVHGLDIFTKNWCMNCEETEKQDDLIFRCGECEFKQAGGKCLVKIFSHKHKHNYPLSDFGSMGEH